MIHTKMDYPERTVLMARPSMLPENICPKTGLPNRPPELVRSRQLGFAVANVRELIIWLENTLSSFHSCHVSDTGNTIMVACEIVDAYLDDSMQLIDSCTEDSIDSIFKDSVHCAYWKVWRVSALNNLYSSYEVSWLSNPPNLCERFISFLKCPRENLKVYIIELIP